MRLDDRTGDADVRAQVLRGFPPAGSVLFTLAGFADLDFTPNPAMPVSRNDYTFTAHDGGTRAVFVSTFASAEALAQVLDMGIVEGATEAINQIDALVAS